MITSCSEIARTRLAPSFSNDSVAAFQGPQIEHAHCQVELPCPGARQGSRASCHLQTRTPAPTLDLDTAPELEAHLPSKISTRILVGWSSARISLQTRADATGRRGGGSARCG